MGVNIIKFNKDLNDLISRMKKRIRLSMVIETDILYGGGTEKTILAYNKYIDRDEFDIRIFDTNIIDRKRLSIDEVRSIYNLPGTEKIIFPGILNNLLVDRKKGLSSQRRSISKDLYLIYSIVLKFFSLHIFNRKKLKKLMESDVIYVLSDYQIFYLVIPIRIFSGKRIKFIFGTHNYLPIERRFLNRIENKFIGKFIDAVHYTSPAIFNLSSIKRESDFIVPSGVDTQKFRPLEKKGDRIKFLFVGRLVEYKGIRELLEAWSLFPKRDDSELHIVGTGEMEHLVRDYVSRVNGIVYHGFVSEEELPSIYGECDILVFPTYGIRHDEYFGLVVIEALSSGEYVILGEGMRGVFDYFEREGVLEYTSTSPEDIKNRMLNSYMNIGKLRERVLGMRDYIVKNYDWKNIAKQFSENVKKILKN